MKRIALLAVVGAALLALPSAASARTDCSYTSSPVYTSGGVTGDALLGVCLDTNTAFDGGYLEVGSGGPGVYAVIDGSDSNPGQAAGYAALSTYENGGKGDCPSQAGASGTNSGGCFVIRDGNTPVVVVPGLPFACGNTTGPDWANAGRDGCYVP